MHNAWLTLKGGEKMSKSLGNGYTAMQLKEMGFDPLAHKYLVLTSHYRKGLEFSLNSLKASQTALFKLRNLVADWPEGGEVDEDYKQQFINLLADDLQVPEAIALTWGLAKDEKIKPEDKKATLLDFDKVLGLNLGKTSEEEIPEEIKKLADERLKARMDKNWKEADRLRDLINKVGFEK
jgi:cysteinyl-tRNA synthetase